MKKHNYKTVIRAINHYVIFFLLVAFVVTCCMLLFLSTLRHTMGIEFSPQNIAQAAKLTFGNVLLLTLLLSTLDIIRRRLTVDIPVRRITQAAQRITQGDFSVRIKPLKAGFGSDGFNEIIHAINQMAQELSGIETLRTDFVANVSHELKTPLAVIANYATMLQSPGLSREDQQAYAASIGSSSRQLAGLITNILKLSKLENQQIFPKQERFDLSEQLRQCLLGFESRWEEKALNIELEIPDGIGLYSDQELLELVWNNLISNAIKFTPHGGTVGIRLECSDTWVRVCVWDTGCGMTAETGKHIFEKFYQADTSHAVPGNGLGLALVKRVVDILHGQITVTSIYNEGSRFTVSLRRQ